MKKYAILPHHSRPHIITKKMLINIFLVYLGIKMMKIDSTVGKVLSFENINHFTTLEIRTAYLALKDDSGINPNNARRFVYTELLKLVKKGWLRKSTSKKKTITTFVKTEQFNPRKMVLKEHKRDRIKLEQKNNDISALNKQLVERLNDHKNKLLLGIGEIEEYKQLCNNFPDLRSTLQPKYNQVREQNSKLLGSIKAIESLTLNS